jgi:hypothetical protein
MPTTLIRGARVFDGSGAPASVADVLVEGDRILAVDADVAQPDGAEVVDAAGKFLMPGMIDSHVHATLFGEEGLLTYARMGVTTVKDLGGAFDDVLSLRQRSRDGAVPGARVLCVGAFVEGDPPSWGPMSAALPWMQLHRTEADVERTIARAIEAGVDGIKMYAGLPPDLVAATIREVAGRLPVTGHLMATKASEAVEAGIDCMEHLQLTLYRDLIAPDSEFAFAPGDHMGDVNYWGKVRRGWETIDATTESAKRTIGAMAERGTRMVPTLVLGARTDIDFTPEEDAAFTSAQRERMQQRAQTAGAARWSSEMLRPSAERMMAVIRAMHAAGVRLLPGTDCGAVGVPPGYGYHMELALLAQELPNATVLASATSGAAAWLRRDDLGAIAPGKRADLVLIDGDPLSDIADTRKIAAVWMDGVLTWPN